MKHVITLIISIVALTVNAQGVADTPFCLDFNNFEATFNYVKSLGYVHDWRDTVVNTSIGPFRYVTAKKNEDNSNVEIKIKIFNDNVTQVLYYVCYNWQRKKDMPKGLPKEEFTYYKKDDKSGELIVIRSGLDADYSIYRDMYKNHFSIGNGLNPYRPIRGATTLPRTATISGDKIIFD